jgi:uncharacterized protein (UPF0332 family)
MNEEQAGFIKKAEKSIGAAELLKTDGFYEFSVLRSYYTMFYCAKALLLLHDLRHSKHSAVIAAFGEKFAKTGALPIHFHKYLIDAEDKRIVGDYDVVMEMTEEQAQLQLTRAREFIDLAKRTLQ